MAKKTQRENSGVLVIGLGRFGTSLAMTLEGLGREVLGVERDPELVHLYSSRFPLVEADATIPEALDQLGAQDFSTAVVGVGTSLEASVLIAGNLVDLGTPHIWAKAISSEHGRILQRIGVHHVVYPEHDAGNRVAHLVSERMLDFIEMDDGFTIVKMRPPRVLHNVSIGESKVFQKYGVTVLGVKHPGEPITYAHANTVIGPHDVLVVSGDTATLEKFAKLEA